MRINSPLLATTGLLLSLTSLTSEAILTPYTSADQSLVYSSVSNITWTADANLLGSLITSQGYNNIVNAITAASPVITDTPNFYDTPSDSGTHTLSTVDFGVNGLVSWFGAQAFVSYLNTINYAGSNQWALPSAGANPKFGYHQSGGQFGQLFYSELGGRVGEIPNTESFTNEQTSGYWLGPEYGMVAATGWTFVTYDGRQDVFGKDQLFCAWAVMSAVPIQGAIWLMGSGLLGLLGLKRRGHAG
ncbi:hypothetical protein JWZ98_02440 [Methylomonas sp. EFPC1]|uniref:hypothetical protein n=1 Tax=Methylomonas sp. EFPC1 TaxID=2812647 RepID=UPI0019670EE7|nr:hypothetical protein [Methylomonas sp. EFPC1]QSB01840.1 hypothetical protein JWZ98_02440 [Methylomonas sp. EFPC1]